MNLKKILLILSLILIFLFSIGSYFLHIIHLTVYKKEFKTYIKNNKSHVSVTHITISSNQLFINSSILTWEDNNEEMVYEGRLYDIFAVTVEDTIAYLTLVCDLQQVELNKKFSLLYDSCSNSDSNSPLHILKMFFTLKYIAMNFEFIFKNSIETIQLAINPLEFQIINSFLDQTTPPPKQIIYVIDLGL